MVKYTEEETFDTIRVFTKTDMQLSGFSESSANKIEFIDEYAYFLAYEYSFSGSTYEVYRIYSFKQDAFKNVAKFNTRGMPRFTAHNGQIILNTEAGVYNTVVHYKDFNAFSSDTRLGEVSLNNTLWLNFAIGDAYTLVNNNLQLLSNSEEFKGVDTTYFTPLYDKNDLSVFSKEMWHLKILNDQTAVYVDEDNELVKLILP